MDKSALIRKMAIGLLPLLVFILADEIFGTKVGLIVAIITGIIQLFYFYIRYKKIEKFVLIDTLLILLLGGISLISHNDLFFKIKPALIELILVIVIGISAFSPKNIVLEMQKRYMGEIDMNEDQLRAIRKNLVLMFWVFLTHTILIVYSAFFMSTEAWGFISTALFYIVFGVIFIGQFLMMKRKQKNIEWLPLLNMEGAVVGKAPREVCKKNKELIYPVIRLHIFNLKGQIFLQKRKKDAPTQPGKWDAAVAGHVIFGEKIEEAVKRESLEELNLSDFDFFLIERNMFYGETTTAMIFVFGAFTDKHISPNMKETDGGDFFDLYAIKDQLGEENLSAGVLKEWPILVKLRKEIMKK